MEPSISAKQKEIAVISDCARKSIREQLRLGDDRSLSRRGQVRFCGGEHVSQLDNLSGMVTRPKCVERMLNMQRQEVFGIPSGFVMIVRRQCGLLSVLRSSTFPAAKRNNRWQHIRRRQRILGQGSQDLADRFTT